MINFSSEERTAYIQASQHLASGEETGLKEEADETALEYDEADEIPYSVSTYTVDTVPKQPQPIRPEAGRFPSDIQYQRGLARPTSSDSDHSLIVAAAAVSGATFGDSDDHEQAYVMVSKDQPRHHSRSSSAFSYDETVSIQILSYSYCFQKTDLCEASLYRGSRKRQARSDSCHG